MNLLSIGKIYAPVGRGSIMVIVALFLSSASLRIMTSANSAFAKDNQLPTTTMPTATKPNSSKNEEQMDQYNKSNTKMNTATHSEISGLINALTERETQVQEREKQIEMRIRALSVADAEIEKRLKDLSETEDALRATLSLADEASEKDILRLTAVYESMKPKDAAILFEEMEPNFAAGFLGRMRPDVAAQVMTGLSPQIAYSISVILAGRNASVPKT